MNKPQRSAHRAALESQLASSSGWSTQDAEFQDKINVYRVVTGFLLASLLWKGRTLPMFYAIYHSIPLQDPFFPVLMRSPQFLTALFLTPIVSGLAVLFVSDRKLILAQSFLTLLATFGLCIHQGTYNDVTFVTCFWTSVWCCWYGMRMHDSASDLYAKGGKLAVVTVSLVFLGSVAGKLTPGYWSGEVFYQTHFVDRDFWIFNLLRSHLSSESLRGLATYLSRLVIAIEMLCAFLWLIPTRWACGTAIGVLVSMTILSSIYSFSFVCCLLGLAIVGLHQPSALPQLIFQSKPMSKLVAE